MTLAVVDDDVDVRAALGRLLRAMGHQVRVFSSAEEFAGDLPQVDCLILDIRLPGLNGLELREQMRAQGRCLPLVFITADGDYSLGSEVPAGVPTLRKPFDEDTLLAALGHAAGPFN
jgi:FixJ family two-component response regulator